MPSARLVSEGVNDFVEVEGAIDNWFDARSIDDSYEIHLMHSAADNQTLKPASPSIERPRLRRPGR
jgi:hypothetical protein